MPREIRLFVSCSPDLAAEREVIGRMVAGLPVSVGWEIAYTPLAGEDRNAGVSAALGADIVLVLLGRDFAAPMGAEWDAAWLARPASAQSAPEMGARLMTFRKDVSLSPSALQHLRATRAAGVRWEEFATPDDLRRVLPPRLARLLLDRQPYFGLELPEVEALVAVARSAPQTDRPEDRPEDAREGAGRSAVILGRGNM